MRHVIKMVPDKVTKNTIRFAEVPEPGQPPIIRSLYIQSWALPIPKPNEITVTIEDEDIGDT